MSRILILEDDVHVLNMLQAILEREGYEVTTAADGDAGIKSYTENPADLVISDLLMPEKGGAEAMMELRYNFPDIKFIAMSGGGRVAAEHHLNVARQFGARYVFTKPVDRRALLDAVRRLIN
jgi:CheY-like chemotaxis protein